MPEVGGRTPAPLQRRAEAMTPIINQRVVRARRTYPCDGYRHEGPPIRKGENYARLYGYAHQGDPPSVMRICADCVDSTISLPPRPDRGG